jgi:transposase-like protein
MFFNTTGISANFFARYFGIEVASAFRIMTAIRGQMMQLVSEKPFGGPGAIVEIDETFVAQVRGASSHDAVVFGICEGGRVWSQLVPDRSRATLFPIISRMIRTGTQIHSDQWTAYQGLDSLGYDHRWVNHSQGVFGREGVSTTKIDAYWLQLKRTLRGTYKAVSRDALPNYIKESEVRFNLNNDPRRLYLRFLMSIPQVSAA